MVRSGDRRCAGFFGTRSKPLTECNEQEIKLALDSWTRHREWERLFRACLELPLKYSLSALERLRESSWKPDVPELAALFREITQNAPEAVPDSVQAPSADPPLLAQWLQEGRTGPMARQSERELLEALTSAEPIEGVKLVGALAGNAGAISQVSQAIEANPHWLVRLAGAAAGFLTNLGEDTNQWARELSGAATVTETWPGKATPTDLEALSAVPGEAWIGRLGATRRILRAILAYRITTGEFESMVVEADELTGEFVPATDVEFATDDDNS